MASCKEKEETKERTKTLLKWINTESFTKAVACSTLPLSLSLLLSATNRNRREGLLSLPFLKSFFQKTFKTFT